MKMKLYNFAAILGLFFVALVSCTDKEGQSFYGADDVPITSYLKSDTTQFSKWMKLMDVANLSNALAAYNPYGDGFTLFAPNNKAIDEFVSQSIIYNSFNSLLSDTIFVKALVKYHIVNKKVSSVDFSFGTLPDTTISGDYITISFSNDISADSTSILINNSSYVTKPDIEQSNGYVHQISKVLEPNVYSAFEWILQEPSLTLFAEALEKTGVSDSMKLYMDPTSNLKNRITVWAVSNEVFAKQGINSYADLESRFVDPEAFNLYMAYHIMKGDYYLNEIADGATGTFETYALLPISVGYSDEVRINSGGEILDTLISGNDTISIDYERVLYDISNRATLNGPVHFVDNLLDIESVGYGDRTWRFRDDEPILQDIYSRYGGSKDYSEELIDLDRFNWLDVKGVSSFIYSTQNYGNVGGGYLKFSGNFTVDFTTTKLLPGKYELRVIVFRKETGRVQFYWNDFPMGGPIDMSIGQTNDWASTVVLGDIEVTRYGRQKLTMNNLNNGTFVIFRVQVVAK